MQIPSLIFTKAVTARLSWLLNVIYRIILTCCLVVVLGSVLDSGPEASSWNRSSSRLLWSGGGVSWGRLGGGPGLWAIRSVKPKPPTTRVHACNSSEGDTSVHLQWWIMGFVMSHSLIKKKIRQGTFLFLLVLLILRWPLLGAFVKPLWKNLQFTHSHRHI